MRKNLPAASAASAGTRRRAWTRHPWLPWALLAARIVAGAVLAVSGAGKAGAPAEEFAVSIEAYEILPRGLVLPMAALLPWAEVLAGWALLLGWRVRWAAAGAGGLFLVFVAAIVSTFARGIGLSDCGCFGFGFHMPASHTVFLDVSLALLSLGLWAGGDSALSLDRWAKEGS